MSGDNRDGVLTVLLVSRDRRWTGAVREAVASLGGVVETVCAADAVSRLTGTHLEPSHILLDPAAGDGLTSALAALTSDTAGTGPSLLVLGRASPDLAMVRSIPTSHRTSIVAALTSARGSGAFAQPALPHAELLEIMDGRLIETRYQPIARMDDRAVTAVEVLARLNHPGHGALSPNWFIPRFEDSGLAFALTGLVSTLAFADRTSEGFPPLAIALNYPLNVLSHPEVGAGLDDQRAIWRLAPEDVIIELTESRPVEDFAALTRSLESLRAKGYRISIDDAGPAVRNLDRLLTLPFTGLKLDKSIVDRLGTGHPEAASVPRIVAQAARRGLNVVAEGVETREMWDRLRSLGVEEAQGYFVARPLPGAAVPVWLDTWSATPPRPGDIDQT